MGRILNQFLNGILPPGKCIMNIWEVTRMWANSRIYLLIYLLTSFSAMSAYTDLTTSQKMTVGIA